jgi:hypothetical protein
VSSQATPEASPTPPGWPIVTRRTDPGRRQAMMFDYHLSPSVA